MVMIALLFMLEQRRARKHTYPLLSCADVTEILKELLPRRDRHHDAILIRIAQRHQRRQAAIRSAYRKQGTKPLKQQKAASDASLWRM